MRIDRERLRLFITHLRINKAADEETLTDAELADEIATYLETNNNAVDLNYKRPKGFWEENETEPYNYD